MPAISSSRRTFVAWDTRTAILPSTFNPAVAISPKYLVSAWSAAANPTLLVERGYGSGVFAQLWPHTDGQLYTAPNGGGQEASAYAGGTDLFVETPYNQALTSLIAGHPTPISAAHRLRLNLAVTTAPRLEGFVGSQDASQHATDRGYDLNLSVATNQPLCFVSIDQPDPAAGNPSYRPWQNNGGTTINGLVDVANNRWYPTPGVTVAGTQPAKLPHCRIAFHDSLASAGNTDQVFSYTWGNVYETASSGAVSATSTPLRYCGPTTSLDGYSYGLLVFSAAYLEHADCRDTIPQACAALVADVFAASELVVAYPQPLRVYPMDLNTETVDMTIKVVSGPLRSIEASYAGSAYQTIGTTDANGYLQGTFVGAPKGNGSLIVRVVGQTTGSVTVANVGVGVVIALMGQSNADGRGDDITQTITTRRLALTTWANTTATTKKWAWLLGQKYFDEYACPVALCGFTAGAAWLARASGATTGHWHPLNDWSVNISHYATALASLHVCFEQPTVILWHQGEEDANDGVSAAQYETALGVLAQAIQDDAEWPTAKLTVMQIGRNNPVADSQTNAVRYGAAAAWNNNSDIQAGGCLAHLACGDGATDEVHFWTQAQKQAVADVCWRHLYGAGRGPRYSSMTASGTTITITCTGGVSPLTISGGEAASPIGWTVTDGGGAKTVTAVAVATLTITLTVSASLTGTVTVTWLSGDDGIGTTLLDSDATTPVPPEPFTASVAAT